MQITASCEKNATGWLVSCPELGGISASAKRLDKATEQLKALAAQASGKSLCDVVLRIEASLPGVMDSLEAAQEKMRAAARLQEEASLEIRAVVAQMREQGLTMRDIAVLLGVTPQRVAQLLACPCDA